MRAPFGKRPLAFAALFTALPAHANRLTFEVWPGPSPDDAIFCSIALTDGWFTLVQVRGAGLPAPERTRWRASNAEEEAMMSALQAFVVGDLASVDPHFSRLPPAPFVTATWMTRLDNAMATGLYIQPGLSVPQVLADLAAELGLIERCGLNAKAAE